MSDGKIMRRVLLIGGPAHGETRDVEYDSRHPAVHLDGVEYWRSGLIDNNAHIYYADAPVSSVASVASGPVTANDLFALGARALKSGQSPLASALVTLAAAMLGDKLDGMADAMFLQLTSADKRDRRNAWRRESPPPGVVEGWTPPEIREPSPLHRSTQGTASYVSIPSVTGANPVVDDCGSAPAEGDPGFRDKAMKIELNINESAVLEALRAGLDTAAKVAAATGLSAHDVHRLSARLKSLGYWDGAVPPSPLIGTLTPRERRVKDALKRTGSGASDRQVAAACGLPPGEVNAIRGRLEQLERGGTSP